MQASSVSSTDRALSTAAQPPSTFQSEDADDAHDLRHGFGGTARHAHNVADISTGSTSTTTYERVELGEEGDWSTKETTAYLSGQPLPLTSDSGVGHSSNDIAHFVALMKANREKLMNTGIYASHDPLIEEMDRKIEMYERWCRQLY